MDINQKPYRLGALGIVFDQQDNILLVQLVSYKNNEWNFPGGGREEGESAEENILRELSEELGMSKENFQIIGQASQPVTYDFPLSMIQQGHPRALTYRGQQKDQFFIRFTGDKTAIKPDSHEITSHIWVPIEALSTYLIFPNQLQSTQKAISDYARLSSIK